MSLLICPHCKNEAVSIFRMSGFYFFSENKKCYNCHQPIRFDLRAVLQIWLLMLLISIFALLVPFLLSSVFSDKYLSEGLGNVISSISIPVLALFLVIVLGVIFPLVADKLNFKPVFKKRLFN